MTYSASIDWIDLLPKSQQVKALAKAAQGQPLVEWGEAVGEAGERELQSSVTRGFGFGGATKKGGSRILSGAMIGSAGFDTMIGAGSIIASAGFGEGGTPAPIWTQWQEYGTRRGIPPMLAVPAAQFAMAQEADNQLDTYGMKIKTGWDAIG